MNSFFFFSEYSVLLRKAFQIYFQIEFSLLYENEIDMKGLL